MPDSEHSTRTDRPGGDGAAASADDADPGAVRRPPGPDGLPVVGCAHRLIRDPLTFVDDVGATYGDVVGYHVAGVRFTLVLHPEYVQQVLVADHDRFRRWTGDEWNVLGDVAAEGLLLTEGEQWRRQRRLLQPAFRPDSIASYAETMVEFAADAADAWTDGETIAANRAFSQLTLDVLAAALFDVDVRGHEDAVTRLARLLNDRGESTVATFLPDWLPTPGRRRFDRAAADLDAFVDDLVAERRDAGADGDDLLSVLLRAEGEDGATLSEREVRDQLVTFLFAGHETTSLALTYTWLLLATHPEQRQRLDEELDAVLGDDDPTLSDLPDLAYTERVVREALRLYPPVYVIFREATRDTTVGGYRVPEGSKLSVPQYHVHRDPRFFDDPGTFRPARWTDEMEADLPEYAYFPFGGGPRHCIGMRFALTELTLMVATLARRVSFALESDPDPGFQPGVTLRPADPVRMRVEKR